MKRFFAGLILGLIGGVFALQNHVVRTDDGVIVIARTSRPPIMTSYLDVRDWSATMWEQYPDVATAVVKAGRTDLLTQNALGNYLNGEPPAGRGTPATTTSSLIDAPLKFLQGSSSSSGSTVPLTGEIPATQPVSGVIDQISNASPASSGPGVSPASLIPDTVLGMPGSFPSQYLYPDSAGLVLPQGETSRATGGATTTQPGQRTPAPGGNGPIQGLPVEIRDRAVGHDPEWVRGLLRSLVPAEGVTSPASQGTTTGIISPPPSDHVPPSASVEVLKTVTFGQEETTAPIKAIRPF